MLPVVFEKPFTIKGETEKVLSEYLFSVFS
jgi:hypothetical protein